MEKQVGSARRFLKGRLLRSRGDGKEWLLRAVSLCLGVFLWFFVVGEDQVDLTLQVDLEVVNLPSSLVIANQFKKQLEVTIRGPRSLIQELRSRHITRPVDLSGAGPGTVVVQNDADSIPLPRGITVLQVQPTNITLQLDELVQRTLPIVAVFQGQVAPGYQLARTTLIPDQIKVSGPKAILESAKVIETRPILLDGLDKSATIQTKLALTDELAGLIGETVIAVQLEIREKMQRQVVADIPVNVREARVPVLLQPDKVSVEALIPVNLVRDTPKLSILFRASVSAAGVRRAKWLPVSVSAINVPGHAPIRIESVKPKTVLVQTVAVPESAVGDDGGGAAAGGPR